eukprot:363357-Chlamydomonas_euryale.AAC.16
MRARVPFGSESKQVQSGLSLVAAVTLVGRDLGGCAVVAAAAHGVPALSHPADGSAPMSRSSWVSLG